MTIFSLILAATLSAGNAEFDVSANHGAYEISLQRLHQETIEKGLTAGLMEKEMTADPTRYAQTTEAKQRCRDFYAAALTRQYCQAAAAIAQQLGVTGDVSKAVSATVNRAVETRFEAAFAAERAAAVVAQAKTIAGAVRPTEAEFEAKDEATLRREMTEKVVAKQKQPVFEENLNYISEKIVDPVIADGRREQKRQKAYLSRTKCDSYAPDALAREIEANLRKNVAEMQAKADDPTKAWGVFPSVVRDGIPPVVERRITGLVTKVVDDVTVAVEGEDVRKTIAADPAAHRTAAESEKLFRTAYASQILGLALERAEREAPEKERTAFSLYVRQHSAAPELARAVETRLRREVLPKWRKVRAEVAEAEATRLWPTLSDRTWCPDAELADRVVARSDYDEAMRNWRTEPALSALAKVGDEKTLLEETVATADTSVRRAFDLARTAVTAQNALVAEAEPEVLGEAKNRKSSFWRRTPDLKAIVGLLTDAVETKWRGRRQQILWGEAERPANADKQHTELFPSVRKHIELVARSILEEMEKPEPERKQKPEPEEPPPEDPTESDQETEEPQKMIFSIVVEKEGDHVTVKLDQGKTTIVERRAKAEMSDYRQAMKDVSEKLGADILKLK